jgi:hypothetical protein
MKMGYFVCLFYTQFHNENKQKDLEEMRERQFSFSIGRSNNPFKVVDCSYTNTHEDDSQMKDEVRKRRTLGNRKEEQEALAREED